MHLLATLSTNVVTQDWSRAVSIAASGLVIVFAVLVLLSTFIASLPRILTAIEPWFPEPQHGHGSESHPESQIPEDEVIAAIGFVLHREFQDAQIQDAETQNQANSNSVAR